MVRKQHSWLLLSAACVAAAPSARAAVDTFQIIVDRTEASGGNALASWGYDPAADTLYTATFGAGGAVRIIADASTAPASSIAISEAQLQLYYRDGDPDRGVSTPLISGIVLNPKPVGAFPAHSFAIITDSELTRLPASNTVDPSATKRVYRYNLQPVSAGGDARDVMTTLLTLADMSAIHGSPTSTTSNSGRQGAFSLDGQQFYYLDTSTAYGGLYKTDVLTGATSLLLNASGINTEPGVVPAPGGGDRIVFQGTGSNTGGVSYVDHDGPSTTGVQTLVPAGELADFLERPLGAADVFSVTVDAAENLYFFDTNADVLVRRDTLGRLSKVTSNVERLAFRDQVGKTGSVNGNMLRLQARVAEHPTAGEVTQILYAEQTSQNYVAGVYAFAPGDFNRDGIANSADVDLFKPVLTPRGVLQTDTSNYRYDLNGNAVVDWRDVRVLQQFLDFGDGDVDLNGLVDFADFQILQNNFGTAGSTFIQGDLDGDDDVDFSDFQLLQNSFGYQSSILGTGLAPAPFNAVAWNSFVASVPEPGAATILALAGPGLFLRRRRRRSCV